MNTAAAVAGVAGAASGGDSYGGVSRPTSAGTTYRPPATGGYGQKGAFDACAAVYGAVDPQRAAICRQRSTNMSSLR